jgi:hypothetical protein
MQSYAKGLIKTKEFKDKNKKIKDKRQGRGQ